MKNHHYDVSFDPTSDQMDEIYSWTTFPFNNFSVIDQSYRKKDICIAMTENTVIGFFAYKLSPKCIEIVIAETKTEFRNKGVTRLLLKELAQYLLPHGYVAYHLYCSPKESQFAWKKLGFDYYPEGKYGKASDKIEMFKIINDCHKVLEFDHKPTDENNIIKIWDHNAGENDGLPKWFVKFELIENTNKLVKPFIFFGEEDWKIQIVSQNDSRFCRYKDYDRKSKIRECFYIDEIK